MKLESTFTDKKLEEFVNKELALNSNEVFPLEYENKKIWVKRARETLSSNLHKFYYKLFPFEVLIPVKQKSKTEAVFFESQKLIKFKSFGINTPNILGANSDCFVMEDNGEPIYTFIKNPNIPKDEMYYFIDKMIIALATIHNNNEYHGGAQSRNFTYINGEVGVIDLEDSFEDNIDLKVLQFRDLLIFLISLTKTKAEFRVDYHYVIKKYIELTKNDDFINRFKKLIKKISLLISIIEIKFIYNLVGRDVRDFYRLFKDIKKL